MQGWSKKLKRVYYFKMGKLTSYELDEWNWSLRFNSNLTFSMYLLLITYSFVNLSGLINENRVNVTFLFVIFQFCNDFFRPWRCRATWGGQTSLGTIMTATHSQPSCRFKTITSRIRNYKWAHIKNHKI